MTGKWTTASGGRSTRICSKTSALSTSTRDELVKNTQNSANWNQILPGTREVLDRIRQKHETAVISNSDGRINAVLQNCGIGDCFACITDSGNVGHEKPHPAIFAAALNEMKADPAHSLYVETSTPSTTWAHGMQVCRR